MSRIVLQFFAQLFSLTIVFTTILIALFGISNKRFSPNSHFGEYKIESIKSKEQPHIKNYPFPPDKGDTRREGVWHPTPDFQQDLHTLIEKEHQNAYIDALKTKQWCSLDQATCDKITRASTYSPIQQIRYQTVTIGLINSLDALLIEGNTTKSCLNWLKLYKDEIAVRGSATHTTIKMNTEPVESYREYREVLTHELGHIIDLCGLDDTSTAKDDLFTEFGEAVFGQEDPSLVFYRLSRDSERVRKKGSSAKDFISGYASKNPFEDFSESQNAYLNHPVKFRTLASNNTILSKKYNYFKKLFGNQSFDISEYPEKVSNTRTRVWDTTRWE